MRGIATPPRLMGGPIPLAPPSSLESSPANTSSANLAGLLSGSSPMSSPNRQLGPARASGASNKQIAPAGAGMPLSVQASLGMGNRGSGSLRGSLHAMATNGSCTPPPPLTPSVSSRSAPTSYGCVPLGGGSIALASPDHSLSETKRETSEMRGVIGLESSVQRLESELAELSASEAAQQQRLAETRKLLAAEEHAASEQAVESLSQDKIEDEILSEGAVERSVDPAGAFFVPATVSSSGMVSQAPASSPNGQTLHSRLPVQRMVSWSTGQWTPRQSPLRVDLTHPVPVGTAPVVSTRITQNELLTSPVPALISALPTSPVPALIPAPPVRPAPAWSFSTGESRISSFEASPGHSRECLSPNSSRGRQRGARSLSPSGSRAAFTGMVPAYPSSPRLPSVTPVLRLQPAATTQTLTPRSVLVPRSTTPPLEVPGSLIVGGAARAREMSPSKMVSRPLSPSREVSPTVWRRFLIPAPTSAEASAPSSVQTPCLPPQAVLARPGAFPISHQPQMSTAPAHVQRNLASPAAPLAVSRSPVLLAPSRQPPSTPIVPMASPQDSCQSSPTTSITTLLDGEPPPHRLSRVLVAKELATLQSPADCAPLSPISGGLAVSLDTTLLCGKLGHNEVLPPQCLQPITAVAERVQHLRQYFESQKQLAMNKAMQVGIYSAVEASNGIILSRALANDGDLDSCDAEDDHLEADGAYVGEVFIRMARQLQVMEEILDLAEADAARKAEEQRLAVESEAANLSSSAKRAD